ncbi:pentatricopeptide repeat-containing protein At4g30825, chloroplastic isoform X1 [Olea europaea var. sylvestris]|uniref:pentatricopeptide repeat-containing protein At4g30825, chloroplastic isoform X1 n=1 Tax=Olea europaea var. sylvestris TaxID=158386 RepID=UPI000C1D58ED|nr:pentatricopeptide repeat-containing protein At4g30825, chloroplastic isoform X1 [Olea europaea var. sylvestris]XP_022882825.1 pentatricopeptide repeat-containing protein At4g30825, chloroplastic isoform X1 [Olea europaea var. sylvestris]
MSSLKLPVSLDNSSYESKKRFDVKSLRLHSICSFSGYVNIHGAFFVNPICKLKHVRVSRIDTECHETSEENLVNFSTLDKDVASDRDLGLESQDFYGGFQKGRVNVCKTSRGAKTVKKNTELRANFRKNVKKNEKEEKPMIVHEAIRVDNTLEGKNLVDFDVSSLGHELSSERCNVLLKQFEKGSDNKALSFFKWMRSNGKLTQNVIAYNLILRVLGRTEDWDGAEAMIKEMVSDSSCELNCQVFNTLIYVCYKRGLVELGARWFRMMLENGVRPNVATFGMLMSLYRKGWVVEEAEFTFSEMRNLKITCESAYSAMITIYTRMGLYEKAENVIDFLREDSVVLNLENWLVLLNAYCQQGKLNEAEQVLDEMKEAGFSPNIVAYNTMITGYGKVSNMDYAQRLFQNLKEVGVVPDETTYRSMIEGWGRACNYIESKFYYLELKRLGFKPNSSNFYTMINLQAKHEDEEGAIRTINDILMIGCQESSILGIVLQAYKKVDRFDKLPLILKGSLYDHVLISRTSCSILAMAYVENCLIDDALKLLRDKKWEDSIFEDNLYHLLICSCKDLGNFENAVKIFTCLPKSNNPNLHIISTMIDIYSSMSLFSEAKNLYLELKTSDVKLDMIAFSVIVRMYVKSGSLIEACSILEIMEKQKDIIPDVYLLRDMLRIYQRCFMHDKLSDLYYRILKDGVIWDQEMYNCVINCCARALPVDELSKLFDEMLQRGFSPNTITFNVMLHAYGKSRLFKKARKVFWMAKKRGLVDVISYNTIIAAYGQGNYLKNMSSAVRKMQFDGFSVSLEAYNCMLDAYGKEGEMEKFRSVLQRMKDSSCAFDHYTYNITINIYGEQGWVEEVADVLKELKESGIGPDLCSYNTLIKAYGIAGMVEDAVALVKEMRENGIEPERITYINLIAALRKNDMFLEAVKWSLWMKQMRL